MSAENSQRMLTMIESFFDSDFVSCEADGFVVWPVAVAVGTWIFSPEQSGIFPGLM